MPQPQGALRTALVIAMAFSHHRAQEKDRTRSHPVRRDHKEVRRFNMRNAVAESENIVVETAEKIFADLADAQTINHDNKGGWKAPLWRALSEAGPPLSWVPGGCGGPRATAAPGGGGRGRG